MLSGQLALRPRSLCHLSLYSVSTAFLLWQLYSCSCCLAHSIFPCVTLTWAGCALSFKLILYYYYYILHLSAKRYKKLLAIRLRKPFIDKNPRRPSFAPFLCSPLLIYHSQNYYMLYPL
jgi:hypothetical protein